MKHLISILLCLFPLIAGAVNLVPNSSFEVGSGKGWITWGNANDKFSAITNYISGLLVTSPVHGTYGMSVPRGGTMLSRAIWLTNGSYTVTASAKTVAGGSQTYAWGLVDGFILQDHALEVFTALTNHSVTGTFERFTNSFTANSNAFYWFAAHGGNSSGGDQPIYVLDAIQVEPGTTASAYAPADVVEAAISIPFTNSVAYSTDTPSFDIKFWNTGGAALVGLRYDIHDTWNRTIATRTFYHAIAAATNTTLNVALPDTNGWQRIVLRLRDYQDSYDEATFIRYPFASNSMTTGTNSILGGHPNASALLVNREMAVGRTWGRVLGPNYAVARWNASDTGIESTQGVFTFTDRYLTNLTDAGMNVIIPLTAADGAWPTWATNGSGAVDYNAWSNYVYRIVKNYSVDLGKSNQLWYEMGPNEPYQSGPQGTPVSADSAAGVFYTYTNAPEGVQMRVWTNYYLMSQHTIRAATNADPGVKLIFGCGAFGGGEWVHAAWTNLTAAEKAPIVAISTHIYPQQEQTDPDDDPNFIDPGTFNNPEGWTTIFDGIRDIWNTESGPTSVPPMKGKNGIWYSTYNVHSAPSPEGRRSEPMNRHLLETRRIVQVMLRSIGRQHKKYFPYDARAFNEDSFEGSQPYATDQLLVDRPEVAALSIAAGKFIHRGFGMITNSIAELFIFTNTAGSRVVGGWALNRTNVSVTTTNGEFAIYDVMGNQISTNQTAFIFTGLPRYYVSDTLTMTQMSNTFYYATTAALADTNAPFVSIDIAPTGTWSGDPNPVFFKWTAIDDNYYAWPYGNATSYTNVQTRWKLDNGAYSDYSQSNHVWISNLSAGDHKITVQAVDRAGNTSAEVVYDFTPGRNMTFNAFLVTP